MHRRTLSIVTPIKNTEARYITRLCSLMALQESCLEHIVQVAPGEDAAMEILGSFKGKYRLKVHQEADTGLYDAIARGFSKAEGDFLGWMGVDDILMPHAASSVVDCFDRFAHVSWLTGLPCYAREAEDGTATTVAPRLARVFDRGHIRAGLHCEGGLGFLQQESMFWRRSLWEKAGAPEIMRGYRYASDFWLWRRFAEHEDLYTLCAVLACFTTRAGQLSRVHRGKYVAECGPPPSRLQVALAKGESRVRSIFPGRHLIRLLTET